MRYFLRRRGSQNPYEEKGGEADLRLLRVGLMSKILRGSSLPPSLVTGRISETYGNRQVVVCPQGEGRPIHPQRFLPNPVLVPNSRNFLPVSWLPPASFAPGPVAGHATGCQSDRSPRVNFRAPGRTGTYLWANRSRARAIFRGRIL